MLYDSRYLQASPDGTPVSGVSDATFAVTKVAPYSDTSSSSDLNTAIIVLIVFACVTAVAIIVAVAILTYCCVCRKKQSEDKRALLVGRATVVSDFNPPRKPDPRPTISPPPSHHDDSSYDFSDAQDLSDVSDMEDTNLSETISLTSLPHPTEDEGVATTRNVGVTVIASDIPETKPKVKPEVEFRTQRTHKAPVITQFAEYIPPQIPPKPPAKVSYAKYIRSVLNLPAEPETGARRKSELTDVEEVEDKTKVDGQTKSD
ncbi:uncharacterized protein LOC131927085 [Physella acuta]|uniref:uncharacterized protein LOC131927085 n=1 Tax=Physella acuta TaxID=109671 RepID=UPI0027DD5A5F|nr:uncharacterized protein LOC131927085 [Physella acuta]